MADIASCSNIQGLPEEVTRVICNAQVVISLAGAARELIDNAIDAGATNIEIRLNENGVDTLEVIDNGKGIDEKDFDVLAKPHCTSKFRSMNDFDNLETFGFRGEALNALTTFSKVVITTKTQAASVATRLTFDNLSNIVNKQKTAGKVGTSVAVHELFKTLPVRRAELVRNSKKEFVKMVNTIQAFALARPDIKFTCSNVIKGKKIPVLTTMGGTSTLKAAIATIFGCRAEKDNLLEIVDTLPDAKTRTLCGIAGEGEKKFEVLQISGYISSTESGLGSHAPDRQFIFVNKRHVDYPRASKLINELYRAHNKNRYAIYVLFLDVHPSRVNVNITPDKRTVQLRDEPVFLAKLRASLQKAFTIDKGTYTPMAKTEILSQSPATPNLSDLWSIKKSLSQAEAEVEDITISAAQVQTTPRRNKSPETRDVRLPLDPFASTLPRNPKHLLSKAPKRSTSEQTTPSPNPAKKQKTNKDSNKSMRDYTFTSLWSTPAPGDVDAVIEIDEEDTSPKLNRGEMVRRMLNASQELNESLYDGGNDAGMVDEVSKENTDVRMSEGKRKSIEGQQNEVWENSDVEEIVPSREPTSDNKNDFDATITKLNPAKYLLQNLPEWYYGYCEREIEGRPEVQIVRICHEENRTPLEIGHESFLESIRANACGEVSSTSATPDSDLSFEGDTEKVANEEDTKVIIKKEDFREMKVLWQFNKSFIFCSLRKHLFIVDQHAADEKFNYESFVKNAKLKRQILIKPITLSLSPVQEQVLRNNLDIFLKNGFDFTFNDHDYANRIQMTSVPNFIGIQCGINEVEEILSYLSDGDSTDTSFRPEKVLKAFASKACRRSVMVGDQLEIKQMQDIVDHLAYLDKPWNCPHGRPTCRLLKVNFPPRPAPFNKRMCDEMTQQFAKFTKIQ